MKVLKQIDIMKVLKQIDIMKVLKQIDIYVVNKRNVRPIHIVQSDTGIQLVFTLKDFTIPSGTMAKLYVQKPSGKFVYQTKNITVSGNTITIDLENQAITEHGQIPYQVELTNGSDEITTFEGLMMVERSLKDSGATESKTVIHAFDELTAEKVAEFRANAERIAADVIATIPDDYTETTETVDTLFNSMANAIKGNLSGTVVFTDDVSPVEHNPIVKVHGKNLLKPEAGASWQCTASVASDGKITLTNTETDGVAFARVGTLKLKKGKTYVYTRYDPNNIMNVLTWKTGTTTDSWYPVNGVPYTAKEDVVVDIAVYMADIGVVGNTSSIYIQIEEGTTATDYEPYIDPSTVTVRRCGKNLFGLSACDHVLTYNKRPPQITKSDDNNFVMKNTVADDWNGVSNKELCTDQTLTVRFFAQRTDENSGVSELLVSDRAGTENRMSFSAQEGREIVWTTPNPSKCIEIKISPLSQFEITNLQIEIGTAATDFELYNDTEYIPATDGTVSGITSLSPNMTILTDTEGVIVECEYIRDTNKVIQDLVDTINELKGV